jgi:serpin B
MFVVFDDFSRQAHPMKNIFLTMCCFSAIAFATDKSKPESTSALAFDLYQKLGAKPGNVFFSSWSIAQAFTMTWAGAKKATALEIQNALHLGSTPHQTMREQRQLIQKAAPAFTFMVANRIFLSDAFTVEAAFEKINLDLHDAKIERLDFSHGEHVENHINAWVKENTQGHIERLISTGSVSLEKPLILVDAVFAKGSWSTKFEVANTTNARFENGRLAATVKMMYRVFDKEEVRYAEDTDSQLLELPYKSGFSMLVYLPRKIDSKSLTKKLSLQKFETLKKSLKPTRVTVFLPRFKFSERYDELAPVLTSMGMATTFSNRADFSGISTTKKLKVDSVIHQADIEVNEEGTVAAAATAIQAGIGGLDVAENKPAEFKADHPFVFLIRETASDTVLFMGRLEQPPSL